jgi:hypothetical protein
VLFDDPTVAEKGFHFRLGIRQRVAGKTLERWNDDLATAFDRALSA